MPDANKRECVENNLIVVPWCDAKQFKKVYEYVYSPELVKKRWALDQISVWESRCHPSLPTAIAATYTLTSAIVQDVLWTNSASILQQHDIQSMYSSAITRFVNLTIELHTTNKISKHNIIFTANSLRIPSYVMDVRNEACHSFMPSLSCLRIAADTAMKYLKETYWDIESSRVENYIQKPFDETGIQQLLQQYLEIKLQLQRGKREIQEVDSKKKELKTILTKIDSYIIRDKWSFIKVLSSEGVFIPNDDDLQNCVSEEEFKEFEKDEDSMKCIADLDASILIKIPSFHKNTWFKVIALLHKYDAIPLFLEALLKTQRDKTVMGQKLLISWVYLIFQIHAIGKCYENSDLVRLFKKKGIVVNWHSMFYAAVVNPCKYVALIIPLIFSNLDVEKSMAQRMLELMAIYLGQTVSQDKDNSYTIFTLEHLKRSKKLQSGKIKEMKGESESIWSLVLDDAYKTWPIGHVINPIGQECEDMEEEYYDFPDFKQNPILCNKNDSDEEEVMDYETPEDTLVEDALKEVTKRKSFMYKK